MTALFLIIQKAILLSKSDRNEKILHPLVLHPSERKSNCSEEISCISKVYKLMKKSKPQIGQKEAPCHWGIICDGQDAFRKYSFYRLIMSTRKSMLGNRSPLPISHGNSDVRYQAEIGRLHGLLNLMSLILQSSKPSQKRETNDCLVFLGILRFEMAVIAGKDSLV